MTISGVGVDLSNSVFQLSMANARHRVVDHDTRFSVLIVGYRKDQYLAKINRHSSGLGEC